ncbi:MAG: MCE family protein [Pirellulaceae bacterium]|nr:MCE family protein [Pirellulaceae bacterium]
MDPRMGAMDEDHLDSDYDFLSRPTRTRRRRPRALPIAGAVVVLCLFAWGMISWMGGGYSHIELRGADVADLNEGSAVMLEGLQVGEVQGIRLERGQLVADLAIDRSQASQIQQDCRFQVGPLGDYLPGNVGVKIVIEPASRDLVSTVQLGGRSLADIREATAVDSVLPTSTPIGMYMVIGVAVLVAAIGLGISWKVARSSLFFYVASAVAAAAIIFLFANGHIDLGDVRGWIDWAMNLIRSGGTEPNNLEIVDLAPRT